MRAMSARDVARTIARAPVSRRTWREAAYATVSLAPAVPTFLLSILGLVAGALSVIAVGLPLLALVLLLARSARTMFRRPARAIVGWDGPPARPLRAGGPVRTARAVLRDPAAWRALVYCLVKLPLALVTVYGTVIGLAAGLLGITAPVWWFVSHDAWGLMPVGSWPHTLRLAVQGAAVLLVVPWFLRFLVGLDHVLVRALLEPSADAERIAALERSRAHLADDASSGLARIERDLHDGTQARFVTLGMALSRLERHVAPDGKEILGSAQAIVGDGLAELREIIRGMHPPALDDGLSVALATLVSRSPVPADLRDHLRTMPPPAAAAALYFAAAELLTNVARHAAASHAVVTLDDTDDAFSLKVWDDGAGGAGPRAPSGTGLDGLRRRAEALDGTLLVVSPAGGPTRVVLTLPRRGL